MKITKKLLVIGCTCLLLALLIGCDNSTPSANSGENSTEEDLSPFTLQHTADHQGPPLALASDAAEPWAEFIRELTNGRVNVEMNYDSTLCSLADTYRAIESGTAHMAWSWPPSTPGVFPLMEVFTLPGLMRNWAVNNMVIRDIFELYPEFQEQVSDDVVLTTSMVHMQSDLHLREPINSLDGLKGKIIGCTSEEGAKAIEALGANATIMIGSELFLALERGVVDGALSAWGWAQIVDIHSVCPYHVMLRISPGCSFWVYNRDAYEKAFTEKEQLALKEYAGTLMLNMNRAAVRQSEEYRGEIPEENFIQWSEEDMARIMELFEPSWDEWVNKVEELGYPGREILNDIIRLLEAYTFE